MNGQPDYSRGYELLGPNPGGRSCSNGVFGDPLVGIGKTCFCDNSTASSSGYNDPSSDIYDDCDDDLSVTDAYGDDCEWYAENPDSCGSYDDSDFTASIDCCACGRG